MSTLDAAAARERFLAARVARLATLTAAGAPHLVPVVFALAEPDRGQDPGPGRRETVYSVVDAKPKATAALARLAHVAADPRVCLLADHYAEDWAQLWWVRADGRGRVLEPSTDEAALAIALLAARYPQQRAVGAVLAVDVQRWSGWTASL